MRRIPVAALAAVVLAAALITVPASAHALLVRSEPGSNADLARSPLKVELWFSEPLEVAFSSARVVDANGADLPTGAIVFDPADPTHLTLPVEELAPGIYTVAWQTLSRVDGHEWFGSFPFTVLNPDGSRPSSVAASVAGSDRSETPTAGEAAARWLTLSGSMLLFGGLVFQKVIVPSSRFPVLSKPSDRLVTWSVWAAAVGALFGGGAILLLQSTRLGGLAALPMLTFETRTGAIVLARIALAAGALNIRHSVAASERPGRAAAVGDIASFTAVVAAMALLASTAEGQITGWTLITVGGSLVWIGGPWHRDSAARQRKGWVALTGLALAGLLTFSLSSHAAAVEGSAFAVAGDALHLLGAASWVAGLVALSILWVAARGPAGQAEFFLVVQRFSALALVAVTVVILTGLFSALVEIPDLRSLVRAAYGQVLLVKSGLVVAGLGLAHFNRRAVHAASRSARLARRITIEAAVTPLILAAVAVLVQTPTPRSTVAPAAAASVNLPYNAIGFAGDLIIHLQIDPNLPGRNRFWTHLFTSDGSPIGEVQLVRLLLEDAAQQLGRSELDLAPLGQGTFASEGANLSQAGTWSLEVYVRRRAVDDLLVPFRVEVGGGEVRPRAPVHFGHPVPGMPPLVLIGGLLLSGGVVPFLWGRDLKKLAGGSHRMWLWLGASVALVGLVALGFGLTARQGPSAAALPRVNPVPPTEDSLARGRQMYDESCAACHGTMGRGDGPVGLTLNPRPADLWVHMQPGVHSDGQLFEWVTNGFPNSAMPAFGDDYSEDDRWHTINFIRTFATRPAP
jgi:copper transport protein